MKQFILLIATALCSISAFATNPEVDPRVLASFKTEFASAKEVTWSASEDFFKAEFIFNDQYVSAFYSKEGELIGLSRNISSVDLPLNLQAGLKKAYGEYWISNLIEVTRSNSTSYYITVEDADTELVLKASAGEGWNLYRKTKKV